MFGGGLLRQVTNFTFRRVEGGVASSRGGGGISYSGANRAVAEFDRIGVEIDLGWTLSDFAGAEIELRSVPWALDLTVLYVMVM